jgi:hypothetical protein
LFSSRGHSYPREFLASVGRESGRLQMSLKEAAESGLFSFVVLRSRGEWGDGSAMSL